MDKKDWQQKGAGHRQRLRDKFIKQGIAAFTDDEVLELILTLGTPRKDCKEQARALLSRFGSLAATLEASPAELQQIKGVGPNNSFCLHFVHGVARRYLKHRLHNKEYLHSSSEVAEYLIHAMRDLKRELFMAIFLDASHAIITTEIIAEGTITANTVYPRELIKQALAHNAAALVIAHNHPSGNPAPSDADRHLTHTLYMACAFMHIQLLDHLIVAGSNPPFSFADHGLMETIRQECAPLFNPA